VEYVQSLLAEREKYEHVLVHSFYDDKGFRNSLNQVRGRQFVISRHT
jgi:hypothetical protein